MLLEAKLHVNTLLILQITFIFKKLPGSRVASRIQETVCLLRMFLTALHHKILVYFGPLSPYVKRSSNPPCSFLKK